MINRIKEFRLDDARLDDAHPEMPAAIGASFGQVTTKAVCEVVDGGFGRAVHGGFGKRLTSSNGGQQDDVPPFAGEHGGQHGMDAAEDAGEIGINRSMPAMQFGLLEWFDGDDARIGDQRREGAQFGGGFNGPDHVLIPGDISGNRLGDSTRFAEMARNGIDSFAASSEEDHRIAGIGQPMGRSRTDTRAGACDQGDASVGCRTGIM